MLLTKQLEIMKKVSQIIKEIEDHNGRKLDLNKQRNRARLFITINRILEEQEAKLIKIAQITGA